MINTAERLKSLMRERNNFVLQIHIHCLGMIEDSVTKTPHISTHLIYKDKKKC